MGNETKILDALNSAHGPLCDDCITAVVGWSDRQQAHSVGSRMAERNTIVRAHGVCSQCGRRKIVNGRPLAPVGQAGPQTADTPDDSKARIVDLLRAGQLDREAIAAEFGVSPGLASTVNAQATMDAYADGAVAGEAEELTEASEVTTGLERDLQSALRADVEQLEPGLRIADEGRARVTDAGRIAITAEDAKGLTVVIDLKAGIAAPAALTRLLACMGAVAGQDQSGIRGILIAGEFHPRVVSAARAIPNVELRRYRYKFMFEALE